MFAAFYLAYQKRKVVEELVLRKNLQIAAILSNPNYDQKEVNKKQIIEEVEDNYTEAINKVYGHVSYEDEVDFENNPFFSAGMKRLPPKEGAEQSNAQQNEVETEYDLDQS